jgi:CCR4-NOT transcriptional complex subunit CAF120
VTVSGTELGDGGADEKVLSGGDSDSDYGDSPQPTPNAAGNYPNDYDDDKPDYASSVEEDIAPPPPLNAEASKAGRMKVIEVKVDPKVVVGDAHYRPGSSAQKDTMDIPKVDFGTTFSHGRQLSGEIKSAAATESITARVVNGGVNVAEADGTNYDTRKTMSTGNFLTSSRPGPGSI